MLATPQPDFTDENAGNASASQTQLICWQRFSHSQNPRVRWQTLQSGLAPKCSITDARGKSIGGPCTDLACRSAIANSTQHAHHTAASKPGPPMAWQHPSQTSRDENAGNNFRQADSTKLGGWQRFSQDLQMLNHR